MSEVILSIINFYSLSPKVVFDGLDKQVLESADMIYKELSGLEKEDSGCFYNEISLMWQPESVDENHYKKLIRLLEDNMEINKKYLFLITFLMLAHSHKCLNKLCKTFNKIFELEIYQEVTVNFIPTYFSFSKDKNILFKKFLFDFIITIDSEISKKNIIFDNFIELIDTERYIEMYLKLYRASRNYSYYFEKHAEIFASALKEAVSKSMKNNRGKTINNLLELSKLFRKKSSFDALHIYIEEKNHDDLYTIFKNEICELYSEICCICITEGISNCNCNRIKLFDSYFQEGELEFISKNYLGIKNIRSIIKSNSLKLRGEVPKNKVNLEVHKIFKSLNMTLEEVSEGLEAGVYKLIDSFNMLQLQSFQSSRELFSSYKKREFIFLKLLYDHKSFNKICKLFNKYFKSKKLEIDKDESFLELLLSIIDIMNFFIKKTNTNFKVAMKTLYFEEIVEKYFAGKRSIINTKKNKKMAYKIITEDLSDNLRKMLKKDESKANEDFKKIYSAVSKSINLYYPDIKDRSELIDFLEDAAEEIFKIISNKRDPYKTILNYINSLDELSILMNWINSKENIIELEIKYYIPKQNSN